MLFHLLFCKTEKVTQRQNITSASKYLDQQTVTLQTNLLVAGKQANATVISLGLKNVLYVCILF